MRGNGGRSGYREEWRPHLPRLSGYTVPISHHGRTRPHQIPDKGRGPRVSPSPVIAVVLTALALSCPVPTLISRFVAAFALQSAVHNRRNCRHRWGVEYRYRAAKLRSRSPTFLADTAVTLEATTPLENCRQVLQEDHTRSQWPYSQNPPQLGRGARRQPARRAQSSRMRSSTL